MILRMAPEDDGRCRIGRQQLVTEIVHVIAEVSLPRILLSVAKRIEVELDGIPLVLPAPVRRGGVAPGPDVVLDINA